MVTVSPPAQAVRQVGGSEVTHHFQVPRCGEARSPEKGPLGKKGEVKGESYKQREQEFPKPRETLQHPGGWKTMGRRLGFGMGR